MAKLTLEQLARWNGWVTSEAEYQRRKAFYEEYERRTEAAITKQMRNAQIALEATYRG